MISFPKIGFSKKKIVFMQEDNWDLMKQNSKLELLLEHAH
jgi:hypothetical protein